MSRKPGRKKVFTRLDIVLITVVSLLGVASLVIAVIMIWLPATA